MAGRDISFELDRFEWVSPERLEVEGSWHGVRRLVRASLLIEVDGEPRRLRALSEDPGSPEEWSAAFAWKGGEIPKLAGAELEVGRSIVVDLPRPRTSKARGAAMPQKPIPATTRADKQSDVAREGAKQARDSLRAGFEQAQAELETLRSELDPLRAQAEEAASEAELLRAELDAARTQAAEAATERDALRAQVEEDVSERDALRARSEETASELAPLRTELATLLNRAEDAESERDALRARAEDAEAQRDALRGQADEAVDLRSELDSLRVRLEEAESRPAVTPDVARLRAELESVERERSELRAQLDSAAEKLEDATQAMPPPRQHDGPPAGTRKRPQTAGRFDRADRGDERAVEAGRSRSRRPAERTARRSPEPGASLADKVTDWVGAVIGTREDEGSKNGESHARSRTRAKAALPATDTAAAAPRTARAAARTAPPRRTAAGTPHAKRRRRKESASWPLRLTAVVLLALLLITLVVIVSSIA